VAIEEGADEALTADDRTVETIRSLTGGHGADVVLDFVGSDVTLQQSAAAARMMGDITIVGIAGGSIPVSFFSVPYEASIQTTYWGTRPELVEVLDLAARGLIRPRVTTFPLADAGKAYDELQQGLIRGRAVVVPSSSP